VPNDDLNLTSDEEELIAPEAEDAIPSTRAPYRQCAEGYTRVRMHISYDGTDFSGWQRQTKHTSIQGTLEAALSKICDQPIKVLGASRTDAGVHANMQVAHFDCPRDPSAFDIRYAIQRMTPESIVVKEMFIAPRDFHAIAVVTDKVYKYRIVNRRVPSALRNRYTYWVRFPLDLDFLNAAAQHFIGKQDFMSFMSTGTPVKTTVRHIKESYWTQLDEDSLEYTIRGDGFLKQMVRNIVGTMLDLNQDGEKPEKVLEILNERDRRKAGRAAPAQGLFLHRVNYPEDVDSNCRRLYLF
jgi:tRNA pseudouridine38-40 synthase